MLFVHADNMWYSQHMAKASHHPHQGAPQCAPCNYSKSTAHLPMPMPKGCPCTPQILCMAGGTARPGKPCGLPK